MKLLSEAISNKDSSTIIEIMKEYDLVLKDNKIVPRNAVGRVRIDGLATFWDQRQYAR